MYGAAPNLRDHDHADLGHLGDLHSRRGSFCPACASEAPLRFPLAGGYIGQERGRSQRAKRHQVDCVPVV